MECGVVKSVFVEFDGPFVDLVVIYGGMPTSVRITQNDYWAMIEEGMAIMRERARAAETEELDE